METYNPDQASVLIGASASTIRNWCKTYAAALSEGANPTTGTERRLTQQDVARLQQVKVWRDERKPAQEIMRLLQAAASSNEPAPLTIDVAPTPAQTAQNTPESPALLPVALSSMDKRIDAVERAVALLETRQAQRVDALMTGIVIGVMVAFIMGALALTLGQ